MRHERLLRQVLEEEKHPGRRSQGSRQLVRSQVSQRLAVSLQLASHRPVIITVSPLTCVCRHHRIRENTIASFKSAAKHVSHSRVFRCKFSFNFVCFSTEKTLGAFIAPGYLAVWSNLEADCLFRLCVGLAGGRFAHGAINFNCSTFPPKKWLRATSASE